MLTRIGSTILEKLKEQGINVIDILRKYIKKHEVVRRIVEDEKFITTFFDNKVIIVRK